MEEHLQTHDGPCSSNQGSTDMDEHCPRAFRTNSCDASSASLLTSLSVKRRPSCEESGKLQTTATAVRDESRVRARRSSYGSASLVHKKDGHTRSDSVYAREFEAIDESDGSHTKNSSTPITTLDIAMGKKSAEELSSRRSSVGDCPFVERRVSFECIDVVDDDFARRNDTLSQSSSLRVAANIFKAYVGSGIMGLPFAFSKGGLTLSAIGILFISAVSIHMVFVLADCREFLGARGACSFGDIGFHAFGLKGSLMVEVSLLLSQTGFCCAYVIFFISNLHGLVQGIHVVTFAALAVPLLTLLCFSRSLRFLAPFSFAANILICFGIGSVVAHAVGPLSEGNADVDISVASTLPIFFGMAVYTFEAIGVAIPIRNRCVCQSMGGLLVIFVLSFDCHMACCVA